MKTAVTIAAGLALFVAATAAFCDWRRGEIPNWLTLPAILLAPWSYGLAFGIEYALHSLAAGFLAGLVPYLLFRRGAIGGGDVKLFGALGAVMGFVVGAIIVYQILFADVSEHLHEYATLRAIGYSNRFLAGIVLQQAVILAALGFLPGVLIANWLYGNASEATSLPIHLTTDRTIAVFALTMIMCSLSGLLAIRRLRHLDPAEVF